MTMFIIQSLLLMAIAYILGCIIGCILHRLFVQPEKAAIVAAPVAAAAVMAPKVEPKPEPKPAPKPAAKPKATPKPKAKVAKPKPKAKPAPVTKDDLKRIKGIGPQNEARLNNVDVIAFSQIASWSAKEQREMGERLAFPGRIEREQWVKQAKVLAKGGTTAFAKRVDKGEVDSSKGKAKAGDMGKKPRTISEPASGGDNLTLIDGVGNALEKKLFALGIYKFDQIAKWTKDNEVWIGNELGFPGRPERENWVAESKVLAKGGMTQHAKRVERGEITSSRKTKK